YYNAWAHIGRLTDQIGIESELAIEALRAMFEIAPRRSVDTLRYRSVSQLGAVWEQLSARLPVLPEPSSEIYPLPVSAKLEERQIRQSRNERLDFLWELESPGQLLIENRQVRD